MFPDTAVLDVRPLLTVSKHCANAIMICGGGLFLLDHKFQVQKWVRYTNVKLLVCP